MHNVRIWDTNGKVENITSRDYYDLGDAIRSAAIDLDITPDNYVEWFTRDWEVVAPGNSLYYNGRIVAVIRTLSE